MVPNDEQASHGITRSSQITPRRATLRNGFRLEYVEQGRRAGTPLLFLHGFTDTWRAYERVFPLIPDAIHAFAFSQRGHGASDRPATGYGPRDFASDAVDFLDVMAIDRAVIVGHSLGSVVAQRIAIDYPERTLGLVLVGWRNRPRPGVASYVQRLTDPVDPSFVRAFQENSFARHPPPEVMEAMLLESLKVPARVWREVFEHFTADDVYSRVAEITAPTLIVWGGQDATSTLEAQQELAKAITGAQFDLYPESGHSPHWEEPQRFAHAVTSFVQAINPGQS